MTGGFRHLFDFCVASHFASVAAEGDDVLHSLDVNNDVLDNSSLRGTMHCDIGQQQPVRHDALRHTVLVICQDYSSCRGGLGTTECGLRSCCT